MRCPRDHDHPRNNRAVPVNSFLQEFWTLFYKTGLPAGGVKILFTPAMDESHCQDGRRYAQVTEKGKIFEFAPQTLRLPKKHRNALIAHELGHYILKGAGSESDADDMAYTTLGVNIAYDRRWPGKGLQVEV